MFRFGNGGASNTFNQYLLIRYILLGSAVSSGMTAWYFFLLRPALATHTVITQKIHRLEESIKSAQTLTASTFEQTASHYAQLSKEYQAKHTQENKKNFIVHAASCAHASGLILKQCSEQLEQKSFSIHAHGTFEHIHAFLDELTKKHSLACLQLNMRRQSNNEYTLECIFTRK